MRRPRPQKNLGGLLTIFQTSLPTIGLGALKHREDSKLYGTDKEKTLFVPQDPFYRMAAEECVESGIGVNLFLFPSQYIDAATLGASSSLLSVSSLPHLLLDRPSRDAKTDSSSSPAGALPGLTGGDLFFHPRFDPVRDGKVLRAELSKVLQRETAYSVTMRVRCSNGAPHGPLLPSPPAPLSRLLPFPSLALAPSTERRKLTHARA